KVLIEGPDVHADKGYWMSTDVLNGARAAAILSEALGRTIPAEVFTPDELLQAVSAGLAATPSFMEGHYALSTFEWLRQTYDGRMDYSAVTTDTVEAPLASWKPSWSATAGSTDSSTTPAGCGSTAAFSPSANSSGSTPSSSTSTRPAA